MDFDLNDEQRQLKDSVDRLLADTYGDLAVRMGYMKEPKGYKPALWQQYAELGLLGVTFAEEHGGLGQGLTETMIIAEAFGRALAIEPYLATVVLAGGVLRHAGNAALLKELVPAVVEGKLTLALAHQERQARFDLADVATTARADGKGGYTLEGEKVVVLAGDSADKLIVTARVSGSRADRSGIGLFLVDARANGVTRRGYPTQDGQRAADMTLSAVRVGPEAVVAGHKIPGNDDNPRNVEETRQYIRDFIRLNDTTKTTRELFENMPASAGLVNRAMRSRSSSPASRSPVPGYFNVTRMAASVTSITL